MLESSHLNALRRVDPEEIEEAKKLLVILSYKDPYGVEREFRGDPVRLAKMCIRAHWSWWGMIQEREIHRRRCKSPVGPKTRETTLRLYQNMRNTGLRWTAYMEEFRKWCQFEGHLPQWRFLFLPAWLDAAPRDQSWGPKSTMAFLRRADHSQVWACAKKLAEGSSEFEAEIQARDMDAQVAFRIMVALFHPDAVVRKEYQRDTAGIYSQAVRASTRALFYHPLALLGW